MLTDEEEIWLEKRNKDFRDSFSTLSRRSQRMNKTFLNGGVYVAVDDDEPHPDIVEIYPDIPLRLMQESESSSKFSYSHCTQARVYISIEDD